MDPSAIRNALAVAVNAGVVLDGAPLAALGRLPDSIDPPVYISGEVQVLYDQVAEGGYDEIVVTGHLYTSTADDATGQRRLDQLLARTGPTSVKAAIEADLTLGGLATTVLVELANGYRKYRIGALEQPEVRYYGARLNIRVWGP